MTTHVDAEDGDAPGLPGGGKGRWAFRLRLNVAGGVILLTVIISWVIAYQMTQRMAESAKRVARTQEVIASIRGASGALQQAEAAHRDYLLSAQDEHLQRYGTATTAHGNEIDNLRRLSGDNARQLARLESLDDLVKARLALLDSLTATLDAEGAEAAQEEMAQPKGQRFTAEISDLFRQLEHEELQLLSGRIEETRSHASTATLMLVGNGILTILVLVGASVLFNRDVTRQERDERRLRTALLAADAANETKTQFLATVSHEIRTPLNAISGMSELLLDTRLDSEQTEFARTVHTNAEALAILIGDLLDSSKIEAGQVDLESAPFDLREMVEGVAEILVVRAELKGVELIVDVSPDAPCSLVGDRNRLRQVVMNLVGNAVKFTEKGEVAVRVRTDVLDEGRAAKVHLRVIDTGIGIAPEAQSRIFERFVQAERSTVRRYGGTGLGLNISRSLLELMGGTLSLESELGRGSTFDAEVVLPIADIQAPAAFGPTSLAGIDVLVVESNDSLRDAIVPLLEYAGASVRAVGTGDAAIRAGGARVIVVGESLPDSSGLDFARLESSRRHVGDEGDRSGPSLVLLCSLRSMMTGYVGRYGIAACVYKPVKQARLIEAVRHAAGLVTEPSAQDRHDRAAPGRDGAVPTRILLVEDHRDNWTLATRILVAAGHDIDLAEDGVKAVEFASAYRYDLILMDIELPLMDGIEATRRIRIHEREAQRPPVPIVALTAHAVERVQNEARSAGMDDYTTKPLHKEQLLEVCTRWIDSRPVLLIADDSPENHVLLANYLSDSNYRLIFVYDGQEAVAAFARQRVSLVLLDIDMPRMNGYEAAAAIRRVRGGDLVPIVALTGYEGPEERQRCLQAGCTGYLSKPIHRTALLTTIGELLGRPSGRREARFLYPAPVTQGGGEGPVSVAANAALPAGREASNQVHRLLARRDFEALVTFAAALAATAATRQLDKLSTVSEELADAARHEDEHRSAWWGEQLATVLREAQRIIEVRESAGAAGSAYDALARVAVALLGVPVAAITLLDEERLRIKGGAGIPPPFDTTRELPLSHSFCGLVAAEASPLMLEDARTDPRVRDAPAVVTHGLVSYGGVPLTTAKGMTLGAFCAMDHRPRHWRAEDIELLEELAGIAIQMIEMERLLAIAGTASLAPAAAAAPPSPEGYSDETTTVAVPVAVDDDIADLLPAYITSRRADVETLRLLLEAGDFDEIRRVGHKMKGSGDGYGLPEVSRVGKTLEHAAALGDAGSVGEAVAALDTFLSRLSIRATDGRVMMKP